MVQSMVTVIIDKEVIMSENSKIIKGIAADVMNNISDEDLSIIKESSLDFQKQSMEEDKKKVMVLGYQDDVEEENRKRKTMVESYNQYLSQLNQFCTINK